MAFRRLIFSAFVWRRLLDPFRYEFLKSHDVPISFGTCVDCSIFSVRRPSSSSFLLGIPYFLFPFMSVPSYGGGTGTGASTSAG